MGTVGISERAATVTGSLLSGSPLSLCECVDLEFCFAYKASRVDLDDIPYAALMSRESLQTIAHRAIRLRQPHDSERISRWISESKIAQL